MGGITLKLNPEQKRIQSNMEPGSLSAEGYLGDDTRNFTEIQKEDNLTVEKLGLTHKEIANRMRYFTLKGRESLESPIIVDEIYEVQVDEFRGTISCPFSDNMKSLKRNTTVRNVKNNKSLIWSDLNVHMIDAHGFYEGKGAMFREDPEEIYEVLFDGAGG